MCCRSKQTRRQQSTSEIRIYRVTGLPAAHSGGEGTDRSPPEKKSTSRELSLRRRPWPCTCVPWVSTATWPLGAFARSTGAHCSAPTSQGRSRVRGCILKRLCPGWPQALALSASPKTQKGPPCWGYLLGRNGPLSEVRGSPKFRRGTSVSNPFSWFGPPFLGGQRIMKT